MILSIFQALITCASIADSATTARRGQKPGSFQPSATPPQKPENGVDPQLERMITDHNAHLQKNENESAEMLRDRILKITNIVYPSHVKLVESKLMKALTASNAAALSSPTEKATLSFNGRTMEAEGDCMESIALLYPSGQVHIGSSKVAA